MAKTRKLHINAFFKSKHTKQSGRKIASESWKISRLRKARKTPF